MSKITLQGHIIVPAHQLELIESALPEHILLTRAEPGCIVFQVTQSEYNCLRFDVNEEFESKQAFEMHQNRTKASAWGQVTQDVVRHYQVTASKFLEK